MNVRALVTMVLLLLPITANHAAEPSGAAEEIARLKQRIVSLEVENKNLRSRLAEIAALAAKVEPQPLQSLAIHLASDDWGNAGEEDILKVLHASAKPLWTSAGKPPLHPMIVERHSDGPLVAYAREPGGRYKVLLDVEGRYWSRMAYQFSHEVCHILANYRNVPNQQLWLEEALCECASLYALRAMGKSWQTSPPYPNWKSYAESLTEYAENRIGEAVDVPEGNLRQWHARHKEALHAAADRRELNLVVAVKLLPIFERHPHAWRAVRSLNGGDPAENASLESYLRGWHSRAGEADKQVVKEITGLFEVSLLGD